MSFSMDVSDETMNLKVEGDFTIPNLPPIKEAVIKAFPDVQRCVLDLASVEEFDTAGFQFICAMGAKAKKEEKDIWINGCSPAVATYFETYNMRDLIEIKGQVG